MTDVPSSILLTREQSTGANVNTWGQYLITTQRTTERASKGYQALAVTGSATISWANYSAANDGAVAFLKLTGSLSSAATLTFPGFQNLLSVWNAAGAAITIKCSGGTGVTIPNGRKALLFCDGGDYYSAAPTWSGDSWTLTHNGDFVNYQQMASAISALLSGSVSGLVLNSAADPGANYLSNKLDLSVAGLLVAAMATESGGTTSEKTRFTFDDRRLRRRAMFIGG